VFDTGQAERRGGHSSPDGSRGVPCRAFV
jgi:hypothetical protein